MEIRDKINFLEKNIDKLYRRLEKCDLCPRDCKVNRLKGQKGYCGTGDKLIIYTAFLHSGEEPLISADKGSGAIFFCGCNLKCVYCQNYKFSQLFSEEKTITEEKLAQIMLNLQSKGAANINLVTPTHFLPQIAKALLIAFNNNLSVPIVYNTSGYEQKEVIDFLGDIIDVYLTDIRYISSALSEKYSQEKNYPSVNQQAVKIMYSQKKNRVENNLITEGLIIRNLVFPNYPEETTRILAWIKENTPNALISIMFQYQPYFKANLFPEINRRITNVEYLQIMAYLEKLNLDGWIQDLNSEEELAGIHFKPALEDSLQ